MQQSESAAKQRIADYSYSYEAALKQLNIKPETLSITDSESGFEYGSDAKVPNTRSSRRLLEANPGEL